MSDTGYLNLSCEEQARIRSLFFAACLIKLKKEIPDPDRRAEELAGIIERMTDGLHGIPGDKVFLALNVLIEQILTGSEDVLARFPDLLTPPDEPIESTEVNHGT